MKFFVFCMMLMYQGVAFGADRTAVNMSLAEKLGTVGGLAYACKAGKALDDYEIISARLLANNAETIQAETAVYEEYAAAKIRAMKLHEKEHNMSCEEILQRFKKMDIFKFIVYADGTVKMTDGTLLKPKRPIAVSKKGKK